MNKLREILNHIGLFIVEADNSIYDYDSQDYNATDKNKINAHREFLKSFETEENNRLTIIEGKSSQLVSQTGIIFSLLSLFIPIFFDKLSDQTISIRIPLLIVLILAMSFYLLTIRNALKNFNIKKFKYSRPAPKNVITYQEKKPEEFSAIEIIDILDGIKQNVKLNNQKGSNLIYSYNAFRLANILTGILSILLCIILVFSVQKVAPSVSENKNSAISNNNQSNTNSTSDDKVPILSNVGENQSNSNSIQQ